MRTSAPLISLLALTSCAPQLADQALAVTITVEAPLTPTCVLLQVQAPDGAALKEARVPFVEAKRSYKIGIARRELPERIVLVAEAANGAACDDPLTVIARSGATDTGFPRGVVGKVEMLIRCSGGNELCGNGRDDNCDGKVDCDDPTCSAESCDDQNPCTTNDRCGASCAGTPVTCTAPGVCETAVGATCAGSGCSYPVDLGASCGSGLFCRSDKSCAPGEADCTDMLDNDNDTLTDCEDPDCNQQRCANATGACSSGSTCEGTSCSPNAPVACQPRGEGCLQPSGPCAEPAGCPYTAQLPGSACDGGTCRADGGCGPQETGAACSNGLDDDEDGRIDCADPSCLASQCDDGDTCSVGEVCRGDGGCAPPVPACSAPPAPAECYLAPAACGVDGGCQYVFTPGAMCDGGTCLADGGCGVAPSPFSYVPSNFNPALYPAPDAGVVLGCANAEINANADGGSRILNWCASAAQPVLYDVVLDGGAPALLAVMASLDVTTSGTLSLTGERPVILAVYGNATIAGQVVARPVSGRSAAGSSPPPGQGPSPHCGAGTGGNGATNNGTSAGGGGGAFGTNGAAGGNALGAGTMSFGVAGVANGASELVPLRGGCAGGNGGTRADSNKGGAGGGAVQLSVGGSLTISGRVGAPGLGGEGGNVSNDTGAGAGGGGSGGALLLEAASLTLSSGGVLSVNGGGGGEGDNDPGGGQAGNPGQPGRLTDAMPAPGGTGANGPNGGAGGAGTVAPVAGSDGAAGGNLPGGGGGGGSVGRLRLNVSGTCSLSAGVVSPGATGNCP